jgi:hypothetical protein
MDDFERADAIAGYSVLTRALGHIGNHGSDDHGLAKVIVDGELEIRALLKFALTKLAE